LSEKMARLGLERRRFTDTAGPNVANASTALSGKPPTR